MITTEAWSQDCKDRREFGSRTKGLVISGRDRMQGCHMGTDASCDVSPLTYKACARTRVRSLSIDSNYLSGNYRTLTANLIGKELANYNLTIEYQNIQENQFDDLNF